MSTTRTSPTHLHPPTFTPRRWHFASTWARTCTLHLASTPHGGWIKAFEAGFYRLLTPPRSVNWGTANTKTHKFLSWIKHHRFRMRKWSRSTARPLGLRSTIDETRSQSERKNEWTSGKLWEIQTIWGSKSSIVQSSGRYHTRSSSAFPKIALNWEHALPPPTRSSPSRLSCSPRSTAYCTWWKRVKPPTNMILDDDLPPMLSARVSNDVACICLPWIHGAVEGEFWQSSWPAEKWYQHPKKHKWRVA